MSKAKKTTTSYLWSVVPDIEMSEGWPALQGAYSDLGKLLTDYVVHYGRVVGGSMTTPLRIPRVLTVYRRRTSSPAVSASELLELLVTSYDHYMPIGSETPSELLDAVQHAIRVFNSTHTVPTGDALAAHDAARAPVEVRVRLHTWLWENRHSWGEQVTRAHKLFDQIQRAAGLRDELCELDTSFDETTKRGAAR